jgi:hypothetical protein
MSPTSLPRSLAGAVRVRCDRELKSERPLGIRRVEVAVNHAALVDVGRGTGETADRARLDTARPENPKKSNPECLTTKRAVDCVDAWRKGDVETTLGGVGLAVQVCAEGTAGRGEHHGHRDVVAGAGTGGITATASRRGDDEEQSDDWQ